MSTPFLLHSLLRLALSSSVFVCALVISGCGQTSERAPGFTPEEDCEGEDCGSGTGGRDGVIVGACQGDGCVLSCEARNPDLCGGACVDVRTDRNHCGACDHKCPKALVCSEGECKDSCDGGTPDLCDGTCVDFKSDVEHCGNCETACGDGKVCVDGSCESSCPSTEPTVCDSLCVNVWENPEHCGECDRECGREQVCSEGECLDSCAGSTPSQCGPLCRNLLTDPDACGSCDNVCGDNQVCSQGSCDSSCDEGQACDGECVDVESDARHCGDCGRQCVAGAVCVEGTCAATCPKGTEKCGSSCVDLNSDPQHCSACNIQCPVGQGCFEGTCACDESTKDLCDDACVDFEQDEDNCGKCGDSCPSAQTCEEGDCECPEDAPDFCGEDCVDFASDEANCGECEKACASEQTCEGGDCMCPEDAPDFCGEVCVDFASDEANCGECEKACASEQTCEGGDCMCPDNAPDLCDDTCVDLATDNENCGECGEECRERFACGDGVCKSTIVDVGLGQNAVCFRYEDGAVRCLGSGLSAGSASSEAGLSNNFILGFSAPASQLDMGNTLCALTQAGTVECWGYFYGLTDPLLEASHTAVSLSSSFPTIAKLASQGGLSAAINVDGTLTTWGESNYDLDQYEPGGKKIPTVVETLTGPIEGVAAGHSAACARHSRENGAGVECWGAHDVLTGGAELDPRIIGPTLITGLETPDEQVDLSHSVAVNDQAVCAIVGAGQLACWGYNTYKLLGPTYQHLSGSAVPVPVALPGRAKEIHGNGTSFCALLESDDLYCWGYVGGYQVEVQPTPTAFLTDVETVGRGQHGFWYVRRRAEGRWYSWGKAPWFQLSRTFGDPSKPGRCCEELPEEN